MITYNDTIERVFGHEIRLFRSNSGTTITSDGVLWPFFRSGVTYKWDFKSHQLNRMLEIHVPSKLFQISWIRRSICA
jgi:hypothetical protein